MFSIGFYLTHGAFHRFSRVFFFLFFLFVWIRYVHVAIALQIKPHHQRRLYDSSHAPNIWTKKNLLRIAISAVAKQWICVLLPVSTTAINCSLCCSNASRDFHFHNQTAAKLSQRFHSIFFFFRFPTVLNLVFIAFVFESLTRYYSGITGNRTRGRRRKISLFNFDEMDRDEFQLSIKYFPFVYFLFICSLHLCK